MYLDTALLDASTVHIGPTIALGYGDHQERILTLSPFMIPLSDGIALLQRSSQGLLLAGYELRRTDLGLPYDALLHSLKHISAESGQQYSLLSYGLEVELVSTPAYWVARLGNMELATFDRVMHNGAGWPANLSITALPGMNHNYVSSLTNLITRTLARLTA